MRSHRGVKPFVCNECGLQFANKSNWQRHVAEHSGARNYACPHCNKRFSRGYYLTDHLKVSEWTNQRHDSSDELADRPFLRDTGRPMSSRTWVGLT